MSNFDPRALYQGLTGAEGDRQTDQAFNIPQFSIAGSVERGLRLECLRLAIQFVSGPGVGKAAIDYLISVGGVQALAAEFAAFVENGEVKKPSDPSAAPLQMGERAP